MLSQAAKNKKAELSAILAAVRIGPLRSSQEPQQTGSDKSPINMKSSFHIPTSLTQFSIDHNGCQSVADSMDINENSIRGSRVSCAKHLFETSSPDRSANKAKKSSTKNPVMQSIDSGLKDRVRRPSLGPMTIMLTGKNHNRSAQGSSNTKRSPARTNNAESVSSNFNPNGSCSNRGGQLTSKERIPLHMRNPLLDKQKKEMLKREQERKRAEDEMKECTFKPCLISQTSHVATAIQTQLAKQDAIAPKEVCTNSSRGPETLLQWKKDRDRKIAEIQAQNIDKDIEDCTFKPKISENSKRILAQAFSNGNCTTDSQMPIKLSKKDYVEEYLKKEKENMFKPKIGSKTNEIIDNGYTNVAKVAPAKSIDKIVKKPDRSLSKSKKKDVKSQQEHKAEVIEKKIINKNSPSKSLKHPSTEEHQSTPTKQAVKRQTLPTEKISSPTKSAAKPSPTKPSTPAVTANTVINIYSQTVQIKQNPPLPGVNIQHPPPVASSVKTNPRRDGSKERVRASEKSCERKERAVESKPSRSRSKPKSSTPNPKVNKKSDNEKVMMEKVELSSQSSSSTAQIDYLQNKNAISRLELPLKKSKIQTKEAKPVSADPFENWFNGEKPSSLEAATTTSCANKWKERACHRQIPKS